MTIWILVTADEGELSTVLPNFLQSAEALDVGQTLLLLRGVGSPPLTESLAGYTNLRVIHVAGPLGLSEARNILLRRLRQLGPSGKDLVTFADPDSSWPASTISALTELDAFDVDDLIVGSYSASGVVPAEPSRRISYGPANARRILKSLCSANIFVRFRVMERLPDFNEELGLGRPFGSMEDTIFGVLAFQESRHCLLAPSVYTIHPTGKVTAPSFASGLIGAGLVYPELWRTIGRTSCATALRAILGLLSLSNDVRADSRAILRVLTPSNVRRARRARSAADPALVNEHPRVEVRERPHK